MRDPSTWSVAIGRVFGITVRVHILFPLVALGLILRVAFAKDAIPGTWIDAAWVMGLLFLLIFFHEMGHCYAARRVFGEANEVLMWPLGGLAYVDVPHTPRAHLVTAMGGPIVNVLVCLGCGAALIFAFEPSIRPPWNPFWYPYRVTVRGDVELTTWAGVAYPTTNLAMVIVARLFSVSWLTLLFNLLPAYPLDGGRMLQSALWPRLGYREATRFAIFAGFMCVCLVMVAALAANEVLPLFVALFIYFSCRQELIVLETGDGESLFGYDFSQGYTSLERGEPPQLHSPRRRRQNFLQRWLQRRATRKIQREQERQEAEERRMDELLEKIQRYGKESLTDEENRFLKRVADRYRNRP